MAAESVVSGDYIVLPSDSKRQQTSGFRPQTPEKRPRLFGLAALGSLTIRVGIATTVETLHFKD